MENKELIKRISDIAVDMDIAITQGFEEGVRKGTINLMVLAIELQEEEDG